MKIRLLPSPATFYGEIFENSFAPGDPKMCITFLKINEQTVA